MAGITVEIDLLFHFRPNDGSVLANDQMTFFPRPNKSPNNERTDQEGSLYPYNPAKETCDIFRRFRPMENDGRAVLRAVV